MKWIDVKDRLPEEDDSVKGRLRLKVLVYNSNGCIRTETRYKSKPWDVEHGDSLWKWGKSDEITHWMPLPDSPKNSALLNQTVLRSEEELDNIIRQIFAGGLDFEQEDAVNDLIEYCTYLNKKIEAAVADITPHCWNCKTKDADITNSPCKDCLNGGSPYSGSFYWEWRGLSLEKTSDKEVE